MKQARSKEESCQGRFRRTYEREPPALTFSEPKHTMNQKRVRRVEQGAHVQCRLLTTLLEYRQRLVCPSFSMQPVVPQ